MVLLRFRPLTYVLVLAAAGCPGDDATGDSGVADSGTSAAATDSGSTTDPSATSSDPTAASVSGSGGTTTAGPTSGSSGDPTATSAGDGSGTEGNACAGLGVRACMADEACMPIGGSPIVNMGDGACLGPREFIECQPAAGCGDAITYACAGVDATIYQFNDTCVPEGWVDCTPPPFDLMPCP